MQERIKHLGRSRQHGESTENEGRGLVCEIGGRWGTDLHGLVANVRILNFVMAVGNH